MRSEVAYLGSGLAATTGVKGTVPNVTGAVRAIDRALGRAGRTYAEVDAILLNEATPVISGLAMETITETIITESTMIGHNPQTPGGEGLGVGVTVAFDAARPALSRRRGPDLRDPRRGRLRGGGRRASTPPPSAASPSPARSSSATTRA